MPKESELPEGMVKRGATYWADFRSGGRRFRKSLSKNLKTARQLLIEMRARTERADYGLLDNDFAVEDLRKQYLQHARQTLKPGTVQRYEYSFDAILPAMPKRVSQITMAAVLAYRQKRLNDGVTPRTVNMDVQALGTMLRWAVSPARLIGSNPLAGLKPLRHDRPKEGRPLERDEVKRLLDKSPPQWRDVWYAFLVTGMRKNELASLKFSDIDWEAREIVISRGVAKNHHARRIPIEAGLWDILVKAEAERELRRPGSGRRPEITAVVQRKFTREHVFVTTQNTPLTHGSGLWYAFMRCCKLADIQTRSVDPEGREIDHLDVHSFRRTFATNLIENGADPKTVQELLGHRTLAMTMNLYAKIRSGTKRQAVGCLSYGSGSSGPDHVVQFPSDGRRVGHKMPTVAPESKIAAT